MRNNLVPEVIGICSRCGGAVNPIDIQINPNGSRYHLNEFDSKICGSVQLYQKIHELCTKNVSECNHEGCKVDRGSEIYCSQCHRSYSKEESK